MTSESYHYELRRAIGKKIGPLNEPSNSDRISCSCIFQFIRVEFRLRRHVQCSRRE